MTTTLKSNWLGSKNAAPTLYRAASKGNVFTRTEKLAMIFKGKEAQERKNARQESILVERAKAREAREARERFFRGISALSENPDAKVRHGKDTIYIQPRVKGSFGPKITL